MWPELKSFLDVLPIFIGVLFILDMATLVFISLCTSVLKEALNKNKVSCRSCGKLHKKTFEFANIAFCSYDCFEKFCSNLEIDKFLKLNKIDTLKEKSKINK